MSKYYDKEQLPKTDEVITFNIGTSIKKNYKEKYYDKCYECSDLVDKLKYITNEFIILKQRIDKAIEYVENNQLYEDLSEYDDEVINFSWVDDLKATKELLSILRGEDNE